MKNLYAIIGVAGVLLAPNVFATMEITLFQDTANYSYGNGGEFRAVGNSDLNSAVNWSAYSTSSTANTASVGNYFQTFCTEISEEFSPGTQYAVSSIGNSVKFDGGNTPIPITLGVAYLYSQFAAGTLANYDYSYGSGRVASAGVVQQAIWNLLGETGDGEQLAGFALTDLQNSGIPQIDWTLPSNGKFGVQDMVLGQPGFVQDQLVVTAVPEPTTLISGALLLLPFGASTIRTLRRNRAA